MADLLKIPTELIQRFTPKEAFEYQLIPYASSETLLSCYGQNGVSYRSIIEEVAVLLGYTIEVSLLENDQFEKLFRQYYRGQTSSQTSAVTQIGSGQGFLINIIEEAFDNNASDIHIEIYEERCRVRFRIDGKLIERYVIAKSNYASLTNQVKILSSLDISERRLPQDGRILFDRNGKRFDLRVSSLPTIHGEKMVLRLLTRRIELLELANLGFSDRQLEDYCRAIERPYGLVLICGPTGSGKSTTLYATLRRLNGDQANILTIEDPVEYTLGGVNQVQLKEEIGLTFGSALRTFLRQDPDIIMLGEIRDAPTAQMAIRSSLTGHLIFSTIHTNSAWGSVARLVDMDLHPYLIANSLVLCISQRLVRLLCPICKKLSDEPVKFVDRIFDKHYTAIGCVECYHTGYRGRRAIYEVIPIDEQLAHDIRTSKAESEIDFLGRGITSLGDAACSLLESGQTSLEEVLSVLNN